MPFASGRKWLLILAVVGIAAVAGTFVLMRSSGKRPEDAAGPAGAAPNDSGEAAQASSGGEQGGTGSGKDRKNGKEKEKTPIPVSVAAVAVGPVSSYITSTANLVPENDVKVLAESEGRVTDVLVEEGDRVSKGQPLSLLAREDAEIALRKARVKEENARMKFERAEKMVTDQLVSREEFDRLRTEHEVARQEAAEAQWKLDKTTIRSPFRGRITERIVQPGQHVRPGDVLYSVADFDPLIARIYLPERDVFGLQEGREVRIRLKASEETRFRGRIRQISPIVDPSTGTVKVTVEAIEPPAEVRPGAFVSIDIIRETRPRAVLIPREAVIRELADAYVFVAKGEKAERRTIALGLEEGPHVEAVSGVKAGEQVIIAGQGGLRDGAPIKVIPTSEASDLQARVDHPRRG
jgi:membrane fusion protein (multidrug efflux system)